MDRYVPIPIEIVYAVLGTSYGRIHGDRIHENWIAGIYEEFDDAKYACDLLNKQKDKITNRKVSYMVLSYRLK